MDRRSGVFTAAVALLAVLALFSIYLAMTRIYQVDEAQNLYMGMIIGTRAWGRFHTTAPMLVLGPLAWLGRHATAAVPFFLVSRMLFLGVLWINFILIALNLGADLRRKTGLIALLAAGTLAPLWDYGFEIRHDNLLLTGLLVCWWLIRNPKGGRTWAYAVVGFVLVLLQFMAFKSFIYWIPFVFAILVFPPPWFRRSRWRLASACLLGAVAGLLVARVCYSLTGVWPTYLSGLRLSFVTSRGVERFMPWDTLQRLMVQTPLLLAAYTGAILAWVQGCRLNCWVMGFNWENGFPELLLATGSLGILIINPTPFPYNLVLVVPFFLLTVRPWFESIICEGRFFSAPVRPWVIAVVLFTHGVPFLTATLRHLDWSNDRQNLLIETAEALTDPKLDGVYDGVGLVPTRASIGYRWYLHSLNIAKFLDGTWPSVRTMLAANPPAVILANYRTDWLRNEDKNFILSHYVPLADDIWVLGAQLPAGGGTWECLHPGRYQVLPLAIGPGEDRAVRVDGRPMDEAPRHFEAGLHTMVAPSHAKPLVIWVGPRLEGRPALPPGDHRQLFVNWY